MDWLFSLAQLRELEAVLDAGPAASGGDEDQWRGREIPPAGLTARTAIGLPSRTSGPHVGRLTGQPSHLLLPFIPSTAEDVTAVADSAVPASPAANATQARATPA